MCSEENACNPGQIISANFNANAKLPHGLKVKHIEAAMTDFTRFLGFVNKELNRQKIQRLESMLMPANLSSMVGEFMSSNIPKHCPTLVKNSYHNGHPDLVPTGVFMNDSVQHSGCGIEIKASRYLRGWQGHNPENIWLLVFVFESNRPVDESRGINPMPFSFVRVLGNQISAEDWTFAGRSETSRRTITAAVNETGYQKLISNWIYSVSPII